MYITSWDICFPSDVHLTGSCVAAGGERWTGTVPIHPIQYVICAIDRPHAQVSSLEGKGEFYTGLNFNGYVPATGPTCTATRLK